MEPTVHMLLVVRNIMRSRDEVIARGTVLYACELQFDNADQWSKGYTASQMSAKDRLACFGSAGEPFPAATNDSAFQSLG